MGILDIDAMKASMSQRQYLGWQRYFEVEPWGPWRDNLHAAVIAREVRRTMQTKRGSKISLDQFMLKTSGERAVEAEKKVIATLGAIAVPVSPKEAQKRLKKLRQNRAKTKRRNS
jgi:hypothetical protein